MAITARLSAITAAMSVIAVLLVPAAAHSTSAAAQSEESRTTPNAEPAADWVPFRGTHAVWCTRTSPDNPGCPVHHPTWAADFSLPAGTKVRAAGTGVVVGVNRGCRPSGGDGECNGGAGNMVVVEHGDYWSRYLHLSEIPARIKVGREVSAGDVLGRSGASGTFGGAHLHYDEYQLGSPSGRVAFGSMFACHDGTPVVYPEVLGYPSWDLVPPGTPVRNDGYGCDGHPPLPHPPAPEPPIYPSAAQLGVGGSLAVAIADLDSDGDMDLAIGSPGGRPLGARTGLVAIVDPFDRAQAATLAQGGSMAGVAESGDRVGATVSAGDFDCDGRPDLAVGAPGEDLDTVFTDTGAVNVVYADGDQQLLFAGSGLASYYRRPGDWLGAAMAVGDFNGDGCDDLAIASPGADRSGGIDMGLVWALSGSTAGLTRPTRLLQGINAGGVLESHDQTGYALASGDFDCDGLDDLAAGVPREIIDGAMTGAVMVVYGTAAGFRSGEALYRGNGLPGEPADGELVGVSLAAGDIDGDGCDDLAVGAPGTTVDGKKNVGSTLAAFGGHAGLVQTDLMVELTGLTGLPGTPRRGDRAGTAVAVADIDCDGYADVVVGVPGRDVKGRKNTGAVFVAAGAGSGVSDHSWMLRQRKGLKGKLRPNSRVGSGVVAGDVDKDGCQDLIISAPGTKVGDQRRAGAVHVVFGTPSGSDGRTPLRVDQRWAVPGDPTRRAAFGGASPLELFKNVLAG